MSQSSEQDSEETSEYESGDESSQGSSEYHSRQDPESERQERQQIILVNCDEEFMFLNIWFPMPLTFPHPYIELNELMSHMDTMVPKSYDRIQSIARDPQHALGYIIHHFNIDNVSKGLHRFPNYTLDQVYYLTYVDTTQYPGLQHYYQHTCIQLENALAKEQLELQKKYGHYLTTNDILITLLNCFL